MKVVIYSILLLTLIVELLGAGPKFAPYYDTFLDGRQNLVDIYNKTGQLDYHLAFALGLNCIPTWGAKYALDDPEVLDPIRTLQSKGAEFIVATGGALGPYLENSCTTVESLVGAYKTILDVVQTTHIDVDIESSVDVDKMNKALAQLQRDRPTTTVSYTLAVQAEDYGLTPVWGVDLLKNAVRNNVQVGIVNAMTMEFWAPSDNFGDAVINASRHVIEQMKEIWPEKPESEIKGMLGVTPMLGCNNNGRVFELAHARKLVDWANENKIGLLAFWSSGRDNGGCPDGRTVSPHCSCLSQPEFEFTRIFQGFTG